MAKKMSNKTMARSSGGFLGPPWSITGLPLSSCPHLACPPHPCRYGDPNPADSPSFPGPPIRSGQSQPSSPVFPWPPCFLHTRPQHRQSSGLFTQVQVWGPTTVSFTTMAWHAVPGLL